MSNQTPRTKSYRCALVIDVEAKNKEDSAEHFLDEIRDGWVLPEDISVMPELKTSSAFYFPGCSDLHNSWFGSVLSDKRRFSNIS